jgi:hypothetical protein
MQQTDQTTEEETNNPSAANTYQRDISNENEVFQQPFTHQYDLNRAYAMIAWYDPQQGKDWNVYYMRTLHLDIGRRGKQPGAVDCM